MISRVVSMLNIIDGMARHLWADDRFLWGIFQDVLGAYAECTHSKYDYKRSHILRARVLILITLRHGAAQSVRPMQLHLRNDVVSRCSTER